MNLSDVDSTLYRDARNALDVVRGELLSQRNRFGHWEGLLSGSSLSTATAVSAMLAMLPQCGEVDQSRLQDLIRRGIRFLSGQQNADGGFGDTDRSHSNIATSYLVLAASTLGRLRMDEGLPDDVDARLSQYIENAGSIDGLRRRYGEDRTFVVPILCNLAVAGLVRWSDVPALPFEAAALPQAWYRWAKMPVVSYAVPALVAIGQAKHFHCPTWCLPLRWIRSGLVNKTAGVLSDMQPDSGGYLEATPLTAFVLMSLASTGRADHPVCQRGLSFLEASIRDDGSWPIDTNLATWLTSLAISALSADPDPSDGGTWCTDQLIHWLLSCQHQVRHPFTGADPGGWGWTDLSGAVPDGDDTPAAILALDQMKRFCRSTELIQKIDEAIASGQRWLIQLQNRDGGIPTFCRGWGKLPFDRSSTDLTAHAIRALSVGTGPDVAAAHRCTRFLVRTQQTNGSWLPLWFGNQDRPMEDNPVYGTSKVMIASPVSQDRGTDAKSISEDWRDCQLKALGYLIGNQNPDGGWGGGPSVDHAYRQPGSMEPPFDSKPPISTVEETAIATESLVRFATVTGATEDQYQAIIQAIEFLIRSVDRRHFDVPWPIGFYFAKLWYYEKLYPLIYTVSALSHFLAACDSDGRKEAIKVPTSETVTTTPPR